MTVPVRMIAPLLTVALSGCIGEPAPTFESHAGAVRGDFETDLARARGATAQYQDSQVALDDGFVPDGFCVEEPGLGTMGDHWVNFDRLIDDVVDVTSPELLLYVPDDDGPQLVAVEYELDIIQDGEPYFGDDPPTDPPPAPVLFGQTFDGPMPGHSPFQPWHYDLHAWIWAHNPEGMFFPFNPALSCAGDGDDDDDDD